MPGITDQRPASQIWPPDRLLFQFFWLAKWLLKMNWDLNIRWYHTDTNACMDGWINEFVFLLLLIELEVLASQGLLSGLPAVDKNSWVRSTLSWAGFLYFPQTSIFLVPWHWGQVPATRYRSTNMLPLSSNIPKCLYIYGSNFYLIILGIYSCQIQIMIKRLLFPLWDRLHT